MSDILLTFCRTKKKANRIIVKSNFWLDIQTNIFFEMSDKDEGICKYYAWIDEKMMDEEENSEKEQRDENGEDMEEGIWFLFIILDDDDVFSGMYLDMIY